jgi:hypothetical protein
MNTQMLILIDLLVSSNIGRIIRDITGAEVL